MFQSPHRVKDILFRAALERLRTLKNKVRGAFRLLIFVL